MKSTTKRININLTKITEEQLNYIMQKTGENYTQSITRCIQNTYDLTEEYLNIKVEHNHSKDDSSPSLGGLPYVLLQKQNDIA